MRRGSSVSKALTKQSMPRAPRPRSAMSSQSRISDFCSRIACGPPARIGRGEALDRGVEPLRRRDGIDEAPGERLGGADRLAGQQQPAGAAVADQLRQQRRLDDRGDADPDFRHAEHRALAGDAQIAGGGELEPGAERVAVDPRDDRDRQAAERVAAAMHQRDETRARCRRSSAAISPISAPPTKARSPAPVRITSRSCRVGGELFGGLDDLVHQRAVEAVELGGVVDREPREMAAFRPLLAINQNSSSRASPPGG